MQTESQEEGDRVSSLQENLNFIIAQIFQIRGEKYENEDSRIFNKAQAR